MSKVEHERDVKARRARKLEKKYAAAAERKAKAQGVPFSTSGEAYSQASSPEVAAMAGPRDDGAPEQAESSPVKNEESVQLAAAATATPGSA